MHNLDRERKRIGDKRKRWINAFSESFRERSVLHGFILSTFLGFILAFASYVFVFGHGGPGHLTSFGGYSSFSSLWSATSEFSPADYEEDGQVYYEKTHQKKILRKTQKTDIFEMFKLKEGMSRGICRLPRACRMEDGTLLLPDYMKVHENTFRKKCGLMSFYKFYKFSESDPPNTGFEGFDLFGLNTPRDHMPHFMTDFFSQFTSIEVLMGARNSSSIVYTCLLPDGRRCARKRPTTAGFNPALLVSEKIAKTPPNAWVRSFVGSLPRKPGPGPRLIFPSEYTSVSHEKAAYQKPGHRLKEDYEKPLGLCFKSIIFNPHVLIPSEISVNHILYRYNKLQRLPDKSCRKQITIVDRPGGHLRGGFPIGRNIVNVGDLPSKLQEAAFKAGLGKIETQVTLFDHVQYHDQVATMQDTDVLIAPHGAALTNTAFMKVNSTAIEIMPFGYVANIYPIITRSFGIGYGFVTAEPDDDQFAKCLKFFNPPGSFGEGAAETLLSGYRNVSAKWHKAIGDERLAYEQEPEYNMNKLLVANVKNQRPCLRAQRLIFDLDVVVQKAIRALKKLCEEGEDDNSDIELDIDRPVLTEADIKDAQD